MAPASVRSASAERYQPQTSRAMKSAQRGGSFARELVKDSVVWAAVQTTSTPTPRCSQWCS
eukprot:3974811-Pyramimonas_sp.AAC.1